MGSGKTITSLAMVYQFKYPILIISTKASRKNFLDDIKKNAGESFSKVQSVAGELSQKVRSVGDYYATGKIPNIASSTEATSTNSSSTAKQI